jgi:tetratricopeptide (TPR) repeat protein
MSTNRIAQLEQFLAQDPTDAFVRYALALERAASGEWEAARAHFEHLVAHNPDYLGTYYHYGKLLEKVGDMGAAVAVYRAGRAVADKANDRKTRAEINEALVAIAPEEDDEEW